MTAPTDYPKSKYSVLVPSLVPSIKANVRSLPAGPATMRMPEGMGSNKAISGQSSELRNWSSSAQCAGALLNARRRTCLI